MFSFISKSDVALVLSLPPVNDTHASPILAAPGHADDGHHDGKICLSEWKAFFDWATEHDEGEIYLVKVEKAIAEMQKRFNTRLEVVFKIMDTDKSGELSLPELQQIFGQETYHFWADMDGKACTYSKGEPVLGLGAVLTGSHAHIHLAFLCTKTKRSYFFASLFVFIQSYFGFCAICFACDWQCAEYSSS